VRVAALCAALALLAPAAAAGASCPGPTHPVVAGDTLSGLARRYGVTLGALARANGLDPRGLLRIGLVLKIPSGCATTGLPLARALGRAAASRMTTGAIALDLHTGATVFASGAQTPLAPASTEKLPLATAALQLLGPRFRTETAVLAAGGNLYLKGFGDPLLRSSGLMRLARLVRASGLTHVPGAIVGDESFFDSRRTGPGWKAAFYDEESPPLSALVVDRAVLDGRVATRPALAAAVLFRRALRAGGVRVTGPAREGVAPSGALELARLPSPPLVRILARMDTWSDNFLAETLLKLLGARELGRGTTAAGADVVRRTLARDGLELSGRVADGSGLSRLDRLTAADLVSLVAYVWRTPSLRPLLGTLAVAGVSGTLRYRLRAVRLHRLVRAKTGSTDEASALVGVVGDRYAFAVLENGAPVDFGAAHAAQDRFVRVLLASL